ncbi:MAG TPA: protein kinase, partial [Woeseiaceae bacterium]|nr:protein kinase [Woeseiaceae bacterium]
DVKPQNVIVTHDDRVKVADFGIARAMSQASLHTASMLWGTPHYFAPEQAAGEPATPASDVYAIGIILFEMLSGRLPFEADTLPALALKHMHEPPPLITSLNPAVPVQLEQIICKVLSKEPSGRYRTAGQLERILRTYRDSSQEDTGPVGPIPITVPPTVPPTPAPRNVPVAERRTEVYERHAAGEVTARVAEMPTRMSPRPAPQRTHPITRREPPAALHVPAPGATTGGTDWTAVTLGILALVAMLGLIPLWYLVARAWGVW